MLTKLSRLVLFFPNGFFAFILLICAIVGLSDLSLFFLIATFMCVSLIICIIAAMRTTHKPLMYCLLVCPTFILFLLADLVSTKKLVLTPLAVIFLLFIITTSTFLKIFGDSLCPARRKMRWILLLAPVYYLLSVVISFFISFFSNSISRTYITFPLLLEFSVIALSLYYGMKRERQADACVYIVLAGPLGVAVCYFADVFLHSLTGYNLEISVSSSFLYFLIFNLILIPLSLIYKRFRDRDAARLKSVFE